MNAKITYELRFEPHPWNEKFRVEGMKAWCLVKRIEPEFGAVRTEAVAIFNFDSEAETFAGHVFSQDLHGLIGIAEFAELFAMRRKHG